MAGKGAVLSAILGLVLFAGAARADDALQRALSDAAPRVHGVGVAVGERVVLSVGRDGVPAVLDRAAATGRGLAAPQQSLDRKVETLQQVPVAPITARPGTLVASLRNPSPNIFVLEVENGLDHPIVYDAEIVARRNGGLVVSRTTICPVPAGRVGVESWSDPIEAVIVSNVRALGAGDLACSGGTGLTTPDAKVATNVCTGSVDGSPVSVRLEVNAQTGEPRAQEAVLELALQRANSLQPKLFVDYPMQNGRVGAQPFGLQALAILTLEPLPKSSSATMVILADGVEAMRRPWRNYAQAAAAGFKQPDGRQPVALVGVVPFPLRRDDGSVDPAAQALYAAIGAGRVRQLELRVVGDDGARLIQAGFALPATALQDEAAVAAALRVAEAKAVAAGHCANPRTTASN